MAWARTWPKVECDDIALEDFNELNSELNLRAGVANAAFVEGDGLRYAIKTMRTRVNSVLKDPSTPVGGFLNASGYLYCPPAVASGDDSVNIFGELYGGGRLAWRNKLDGTEATSGGNWWPPQCSLEDSDPYIFHVNELYDVINALEWNVLAPFTQLGVWYRLGQGYHATTKQGALDAAWTDILAATALDSAGWQNNQVKLQYTGDAAETPAYRVNIWHAQRFASLAIPASMTAARLYFCRLAYNQYLTGSTTYSKIPTVPNLLVYSDTTTPVPLSDADWGFGALGLTVAFPDQNAPTYNGVWGGAITGLAADATNYFRFSTSCLSTKPQYIVDSGYWRGVWSAAMYATREHAMFGQYVRLAIKRF